MEFIISQSELKEVLGFVQGIVEKKSTIPVLSNIAITSIGENTIRIVATDLDVTIRCDVKVNLIKPGDICIQARKLFEITRLLNSGDVHFKKEDNERVTLKSGSGNFKLPGVGIDQFPEVPKFKSTPMNLSAEIFSHLIRHTSFAITNEQSRFTLSGAKFVFDGNTVKMVTTDGHRLAYMERTISSLEADLLPVMDVLIPKKAMMELLRIAKDPGETVSFGEDPNHIFFGIGEKLLITRKLSGNFPNYEMVMPKDNDQRVVVEADRLRATIRRVALMSDERTRSIHLHMNPGELEVKASSAEEGEGRETLPIVYDGEATVLGFNAQYLQEFLTVVGTAEEGTEAVPESTEKKNGPTEIAFEFTGSNNATEIKLAGDARYNYRYVLMPLRV